MVAPGRFYRPAGSFQSFMLSNINKIKGQPGTQVIFFSPIPIIFNVCLFPRGFLSKQIVFPVQPTAFSVSAEPPSCETPRRPRVQPAGMKLVLYEKSRVLNSASVGSAKMVECTLSEQGGVSNLLRWTKQKAFIDISILSGILAAARHQFPPCRAQDLFVPLTSSALSDRRGQGPQ